VKIKIAIDGIELAGQLFQTPTAEKVYHALPLESEVNRWGDEIYFYVPVEAELEEGATDVQEVGNICFWTSGRAIAIFFGPTPVSQGDEPRAYEPVNLIGRIMGDARILAGAKTGDMVRMEKAS
jgi:hypothetical protein